MIKGVYTPLSGALAQEKALDVIANNLANASTVGFKGESVTFKVLESEPYKSYPTPLPPANYKISLDEVMPLKGNDISYVGISQVHKDFSQGTAISTKNSLDFMIEGEGFFTVNTPEGTRYTRAGSFTLGPDGALVDKMGNPILGEKGNIFLRSPNFEVNNLGEVYQNGQMIDRLQLTSFADPNTLEKVGDNYFFHDGNDESKKIVDFPRIKQGFLEGSNVNTIKNLTAMILAHRSYEAYQKTIKNFDSMMDKSANTIGSVRV